MIDDIVFPKRKKSEPATQHCYFSCQTRLQLLLFQQKKKKSAYMSRQESEEPIKMEPIVHWRRIPSSCWLLWWISVDLRPKVNQNDVPDPRREASLLVHAHVIYDHCVACLRLLEKIWPNFHVHFRVFCPLLFPTKGKSNSITNTCMPSSSSLMSTCRCFPGCDNQLCR